MKIGIPDRQCRHSGRDDGGDFDFHSRFADVRDGQGSRFIRLVDAIPGLGNPVGQGLEKFVSLHCVRMSNDRRHHFVTGQRHRDAQVDVPKDVAGFSIGGQCAAKGIEPAE